MQKTRHYKKVWVVFLILLAETGYGLFWSFPGLCQDAAEIEKDHALTFEFKTPHLKWAQPYAKGKAQVLFFAEGRGTWPRECVELMQRFNLEAKAIYCVRLGKGKKYQWHGGVLGEKRMAELLEQPWDCFVFLNIDPAKMPSVLKHKLMSQVEQGAGLVLSGIKDHEILLEKDRLSDLPLFLSNGFDNLGTMKAFKIEKGRGLEIKGRPDIPYGEGWQNIYESWQEKLGNSILWAAGKEPQARLLFCLTKGTFPRSELVKLRVKMTGPLIGTKSKLQLWIRKPVDWMAPWLDQDIAVGKNIEVTLPKLPAGSYHLDGRIVSSAGVETWTSTPFKVTSQRKISKIDLTQDWGEIGERISGSTFFTGPAGPSERIRLCLLDKDRRELLCREYSGENDRIDFSFDIEPWMPMLVTIEAVMREGKEEVSRAFKYFQITKRNRKQFNFLMWAVPGGALAPYAEEALALTGVTLQLGNGNPPLYVAANNIAWVPYTTRILAKLDEKGVMTPFCWNDEKKVREKVVKLGELHHLSRQHGVFVYSLGDENETKGSCLSPDCLLAYRAYLRKVYGSVEALNRSWKTSFLSLEDVGLSRPTDNDEAISLKNKDYSRWFDRQAFKSFNYVHNCLKYAKTFAEIDSQAKTGYEGAGEFVGGDDIDLIVRNLGFWTPYPGTTDEVIRSIAPREFPRANWMGYTKDADSLLQKYWRMVTRGMDSIWWWRWECIGRYHGWLAPDLSPYPAVKEVLKDTKIVREGLGDLLLKSKMQDDGIAILYSYPSTFAHKLDEGIGFGDYEKCHTAWHKAIRDLGLQFSYVTDRMLRLGEFDPKRFRVLVLSRAEAIGDKEAKVIEEFVKNGGFVIADSRPGIYDDHCKKRREGVLDDLFGVRRIGYLPAKTEASADKRIKAAVDPGIEAVVTRGDLAGDLNGLPVLILKKVGKGHAMLLNGDLDLLKVMTQEVFSRLPEREKGRPMTALGDAPLGAILERLANVKPYVVLRREDGTYMRDLEVICWKNGNNIIWAIFRQGGKKEPVVISLPQATNVYDMRNRCFLGHVKHFKTEILPDRASFFAFLPKKPSPVKIEMSRNGKRGEIAKVYLSLPSSNGLQGMVITAKYPKTSPSVIPTSGDFFPKSGYPIEENDQWYEQREIVKKIIVTGREKIPVDIPIAYNDPPGDYEVSVTELFTNKKVKKMLMVR